MRTTLTVGVVALLVSGCVTKTVSSRSPESGPSVTVVVAPAPGSRAQPRGLTGVPPGHYPPPGQCRVWHSGRPPGQQPPPGLCSSLHGRVPFGAFVLFGDQPWDTEYDWVAHERGARGSVPEAVLEVMMTVRVPSRAEGGGPLGRSPVRP